MATHNTLNRSKSNTRGGVAAHSEQTSLIEALAPEKPVFPYPADLPECHKPYWLQAVNAKTGDGYWSKGDIPLLKMYCRCAYDIEQLDAVILMEGCVIENARGNPIMNPKIVVRSLAEGRFMTLSTKLHLQPSSRIGTGVEENQDKKKTKALAAADSIEAGDGLLAGHSRSKGSKGYDAHAGMQ